ncbi:mercury methylation corrinoid protein HgcA [Clostridium sp.]|uniref:mercury methylation corrinoid protein HgcA n=1 Tax=Clostridium sp. TaxID=1506 RepID=UPI00345B193E
MNSNRKVTTCCSNNNTNINITKSTSKLTFSDIMGSFKARWGINRMNFNVIPGLYSLGTPDCNSPVMVTGNYKMSFDALRKELTGVNTYILVLDTKGINVWCAASKGTFGTNELAYRIKKVNLSQVVTHKTLILPQLSATGVSAHEVQKKSGFKVVYGPVRAEDIPHFLNNEMKATPEMRKVRFNLLDRLVLTPIEIVGSLKSSLIIFGIMFLLNLLSIGNFKSIDVIAYLGAIFSGCVLVPMFLPWIPGNAFSFKGWLIGLLWALLIVILNWRTPNVNFLNSVAYLLILPSVASYYAMNFTGCSTYTSLSGVVKEMKVAVPLIAISIVLGSILLLVSNFAF